MIKPQQKTLFKQLIENIQTTKKGFKKKTNK